MKTKIPPVRRPAPHRLARASAGALALLAATALGLTACSLLNQEGPEVTCAELLCGKINACRQGIIAQCSDGVNVKYHVCGSSDVCKETWQVEGAYKCTAEATDCEGCRPERNGCEDVTTSSTSTETGTGTGSGGSTTSSGAGGGGGSGAGG